MLKKILFFSLLSSATLSLSCGSTETSGCNADHKASCTAEGLREFCDNGSLKQERCNVGYLCEAGVCKLQAQCDPATFKAMCLNEDVFRTCAKTGLFSDNSCKSHGMVCGEKDVNGQKMPSCVRKDEGKLCSEGHKRCNSEGRPQVCENNGWKDLEACPAGQECFSGGCKKAIECSEGMLRCSSSGVRQSCVDGLWTDTACPNGESCVEGLCKKYVAGAACEPANLPDCQDASIVTCIQKKIVLTPCEANVPVCKIYNGKPACLEAAEAIQNICQKEGDTYVYTNQSGSLLCASYEKTKKAYYGTCVKIGDRFYGQDTLGESICQGKTKRVRAYCKENKIELENCLFTCSYDVSTQTASCDPCEEEGKVSCIDQQNYSQCVNKKLELGKCEDTELCHNNACVEKSQFQVGDSCDPSHFVSFCQEKNQIACDSASSKIISTPCTEDCVVSKRSGKAICDTRKEACPTEGESCSENGVAGCCGDGSLYICLNGQMMLHQCQSGSVCDTFSDLKQAYCFRSCDEGQLGEVLTLERTCSTNTTLLLGVCEYADFGRGSALRTLSNGICAGNQKLLYCEQKGAAPKEKACQSCVSKRQQPTESSPYDIVSTCTP